MDALPGDLERAGEARGGVGAERGLLEYAPAGAIPVGGSQRQCAGTLFEVDHAQFVLPAIMLELNFRIFF